MAALICDAGSQELLPYADQLVAERDRFGRPVRRWVQAVAESQRKHELGGVISTGAQNKALCMAFTQSGDLLRSGASAVGVALNRRWVTAAG